MRIRRRTESGAVAVEAALLMPLITLILLGIVEFGLLFRDVLTVQTAARDAARSASSHSREATYAQVAIDRITQAMSIRGLQAEDQILIYKADTANHGLPLGGATSTTAALSQCAASCAVYTLNATGDYVQTGGSGWAALDQNACSGEQEYLGVIVAIRHKFITGQIGSIMTGSDGTGYRTVLEKVVMRLEPLAVSSTPCKP